MERYKVELQDSHPNRKWCRLATTAHTRNHRGEAIEIPQKQNVENLILKPDIPVKDEEGSRNSEIPLGSCSGKASSCGSDLSTPYMVLLKNICWEGKHLRVYLTQCSFYMWFSLEKRQTRCCWRKLITTFDCMRWEIVFCKPDCNTSISKEVLNSGIISFPSSPPVILGHAKRSPRNRSQTPTKLWWGSFFVSFSDL